MTYSSPRPLALSLIASASLFALLTCPAQAKEVSETRDVKSFSEIHQHGSVDVEVTVGKGQSVKVYADEEDIAGIITEVKGDELVIKQKNNWNSGHWSHRSRPRVVVTVSKLTDFESSGSGDANIRGVKGDHFELTQHGSGDVSLAGKVKKVAVRSQGSGSLDARSFDASLVSLTSSGSGDLDFSGLNASEFTYRGQGSGQLDVDGSCTKFTVNSMGSGDVEAKDFKCKEVSVSSMGSAGIEVFSSGEISVDIMGSGDVDIYGGGRLVKSRTHGSGDVEIHN